MTTYELFAENKRTYKTRKTAIQKFEKAVEKLGAWGEKGFDTRFRYVVAATEEGRFQVVVSLWNEQTQLMHYFINEGICVTCA